MVLLFFQGEYRFPHSHTLADNLEKEVNNFDKVYNTIVHVEPVLIEKEPTL